MSNNEYVYFPAAAIKKVSNFMLISLLNINVLVKVDINTGFTQFIDSFEYENVVFQLHSKIVMYKDKVFFLPWNAKKIAVYDLIKKEMRYVMLNNYEKAGRYITYAENDRHLYLLSDNKLQIDCLDMELERVIISYKAENDFISLKRIISITSQEYIYQISTNTNQFWKFDFINNKYIGKKLFEHEIQVLAGCSGNNYMWIISDSYIIYQLSFEGYCLNRYEVVDIFSCIFKDEGIGTLNCYFRESLLVIILHDKNCIIEIPVNKGVLELEKYKCEKFSKAIFFIDNNNLTIMTGHKIIFYEGTTRKEIIPVLEPDFLLKLMMRNTDALMEQNAYDINLCGLIKCICNCDESLMCNRNAYNKIAVGKCILNE